LTNFSNNGIDLFELSSEAGTICYTISFEQLTEENKWTTSLKVIC
jgi:hypothetical protein